MNDFLANKIIEDFISGGMTAQEAWANLQECRDAISDEKYDEINALIIEQLLDEEVIEEEIDLEELFQDTEELRHDDLWDDYYYEGDWPFDQPLYEPED
jgi:hypothetical protein|tara:strand:+ start:6593 stop:6889 length:297 start_codon:yes stop_codon:yes gene_type:complete